MLALFFAQTPISLEWQVNALSLLGAIYLIVNIWNGVRRKPAVDEIFDKKIQALDAALDKKITANAETAERRAAAQAMETDKKIEALDRRREAGEKEVRQMVNDTCAQMEKFISQQIHDNRESSTGKFAAIFEKLDSSQGTMQALSNDVMKQMGSLQGQLTEISKRVE